MAGHRTPYRDGRGYRPGRQHWLLLRAACANQPELDLNPDGTYTWGNQESGTFTYDGSALRFSNGEVGRVVNRRLDLQLDYQGSVYAFQYTRLDG